MNNEFKMILLIIIVKKITPQILFLHLMNDIIDTNEYYMDKKIKEC